MTVEVEIAALFGQSGSSTWTVPVSNVASLFGRAEWEHHPNAALHGVPTAADALSGISYFIAARHTNAGWTNTDFTSGTRPATVVYIDTHGKTGTYANPNTNTTTPYNLLWADTDDALLAPGSRYVSLIHPDPSFGTPSVLSYRQIDIGSGTPPFNSGNPPVTLAFNDACETGQDNA